MSENNNQVENEINNIEVAPSQPQLQQEQLFQNGIVETRVEFYENLKNLGETANTVNNKNNDNAGEIKIENLDKVANQSNIYQDKEKREDKDRIDVVHDQVQIQVQVEVPKPEKENSEKVEDIINASNDNSESKIISSVENSNLHYHSRISQNLEYDFDNLNMRLTIWFGEQVINQIKLDSPFLGVSLDDKKSHLSINNNNNKTNKTDSQNNSIRKTNSKKKSKNEVMTMRELRRRLFNGEKIYLNDNSTIEMIKYDYNSKDDHDQRSSIKSESESKKFGLYSINELSIWIPLENFIECLVYSEIYCRPDLPISYTSYSKYDIEKYHKDYRLFP